MEYDESYTVLLAGGNPRPAWPDRPTRAGDLRAAFDGTSSLGGIARDLRATDVHPPLYFWAVAVWRAAFGSGLWTTRLFSVACSLAALALLGAIAVRAGIPPLAAMLLTLGCYGFAYTGQVARGFALAQALSLGGVWLLLRADQRRGWFGALIGGLLLGAAMLANYLASFVGAAALLWFVLRRRRDWRLWPVAPAGFAIALPAAAWFFIAQRDSRAGQFPPFDLAAGLLRLAGYACANLFGGLPRYLGSPAQPVAEAALAAATTALAVLALARWRHFGTPASRTLLAAAALAPPAGLLALGLAFDNTPIELRYLAFATPFAGLLLAGSILSLPVLGPYVLAGVLTLQAVALAGLMLRPETMQPQRAAAREAAAMLGRAGVALVPFGNDGVGIVGSFVAEAADKLQVQIVRAELLPDPETLDAPRVAIPLLTLDASSRAVVPALRARFDASPCWHAVRASASVLRYDRRC